MTSSLPNLGKYSINKTQAYIAVRVGQIIGCGKPGNKRDSGYYFIVEVTLIPNWPQHPCSQALSPPAGRHYSVRCLQ
jgi:hypothetical protein